jgi:hypothetical protein
MAMNAFRNRFTSRFTFSARITFVAVIVRLLPVLFTSNLGIGLDDMFQYDMLARSLATGNGYRWYAEPDLQRIQPFINIDLTTGNYDPRGVPTSFRPPLYPFFLAVIYLVVGIGPRRFFFIRLVQVFVGATLVPLTYALSKSLFPGAEKAARIAAWVIALYPMLVIFPLSLATENLFFPLILSATLVLLKAAEKRTWRWFGISGFILGLMALTRSIALVYAGLAIAWIWFKLHERRYAFIALAAVLFIIAPWIIRNSLLNHKLTGIEDALGYQLYVGYNPAGTGTFQYPQSLDLMTILDDAKRDAVGRAKALEFIKADPGRVPYLFVRRAGYFFGLERRALTYFYSNNFFGFIPFPSLVSIALVFLVPFMLVSTSSLLGLAITSWRSGIILIALLFLGYTLPHLLIIAEDRFHLALIPFLVILAVQGWVGGWKAVTARWQSRGGKIAIVIASFVTLLLMINWGGEIWRDADKISALFGPHGNQTYFPY